MFIRQQTISREIWRPEKMSTFAIKIQKKKITLKWKDFTKQRVKMCLFQFTNYTQEGSSLNEGERKLFPVLEDQGCLLVAHTRHMEQITRRMDAWICPYKIKKPKKENLNLLPLKIPSFFLAGLHQEVMSSHPNLSTSCCQGLGALNMYKPAI